jgi:hypothetical protein
MYATRTRTNRAITATHWNGTSWSDGVPTAIKDAHIDADYSTLNGSFSCRDLIVTGNSILTIVTDTYVKVLRDINQDSTSKIHIKNEGNLMILDKNAATESAKVQVEAIFPNHQRLDYEFLSSPISGIPIKNISPETLDSRFYTYNEPTNSYVSLNPNTTLASAGTGFMIRVPANFPLTSSDWDVLANNNLVGNINIGYITKTISHINAGINMIGNPYTALLCTKKFWVYNQSVIEKNILFWTKSNGAQGSSYYSFNIFTNNINKKWSQIPVFQGLLIESKEFSTFNNLAFTPEMMLPSEDYTEPDRLYINIKQIGVNKPIGGFCYDIKKFPIPFDDVVSTGAISIIDNGNKIICRKDSFNVTDVINVRVFFELIANYTITMRDLCGLFIDLEHIYLIDQLMGTTHDLKISDYTFSSDAGEFLDRFKIVFQL